LLAFAFRAAMGVAAAVAAVALAPDVHAAGENPAPSGPAAPTESAPIAGGLRPNAGAGVASSPSGGNAMVGRVGVDGEYWLSKHVGIGVQLGFQAMTTVDLWPTDSGSTWSEHRISLAPAVTVRGSNPKTFPILSLALGYSWGHSDSHSFCDIGCQPSSWSRDASGLYGSLMGAWLFHFATGRPDAAFAIGPMVRIDWLTYDNFFQSGFGFQRWGLTLTTGLTLGFGFPGKPAR
jgi:hypothetical protein